MADLPISLLPYVGNTGYTNNDLFVFVNYELPSGTTSNTTILQHKEWVLSGLSDNYLPLSGGTVTGDTIFQSGLTVNTISATTINGGTFFGDGSGLTNINNLYNNDGVLQSNRVVNLSSNTLNFSSSTNPNTLVLIGGNVGIGILNPLAPLHVNAAAVPSTNETIARFTVSDVPNAYLDLRNGSITDGIFRAQVVGRQVSGNSDSALSVDSYIDVTSDIVSTQPVMLFRTAKVSGSTLSALSARTLYDFRNWTDSVMVIDSLGEVGIGITTPTAKLHINNTGTSNSFLVEDSVNPDSTPFVINSNGNVGIGTLSPAYNLDVSGNTRISGETLINGLTVGRGGGEITTNTAFGRESLLSNVSATLTTAVGTSSLRLLTGGTANLAVGHNALGSLIDGDFNSAIGQGSLRSLTTGTSNTVFGGSALEGLITGTTVIAFGNNAGRYISDGVTSLTGASNSIFIGASTKSLSQGPFNNQIVIGGAAVGLGPDSTVIGTTATTKTFLYGNLGLGLTSPSNQLHVSATTDPVRFEGLQSGNTDTRILTSDSNGVIRYTNLSTITAATSADTYTTGFTYTANTFTIRDNSGSTFNATINSVTGLTVNGILSGTTISGGTFFGNGSGLTNVVLSVSTSTGLSGNSTTGNITLINTAPDQTVTITGGTNIQIVSNYPNFGINFTGTTSSVGDYLPLSGGTVTGDTIFQSGLTANTISASSLTVNGVSITGDTFLTGATLSGSTLILKNNNGSPITTGNFSQYFVSATTPTETVNSGDRWFDTSTGVELVWIDDGGSSQWVQPFSVPGPSSGGMNSYLNESTIVTANTGYTLVYAIPTSGYTGGFFDYTVSNTSGYRAGNIMSIWSGTTANFTETSTNDIGDTSQLTFSVDVVGSDAVLSTSATTNNWVVKVIIRSI